jgi:hypothetical protein
LFKTIAVAIVVSALFSAGPALAAPKGKSGTRAARLATVRADLHRNLDGKGDGFIRSWSFNSKTFTLTIDRRRYQQNMLYAATMTARSIFDMNGVPLPKTLILRDISGESLGEGPFENVPKVAE